MKTLMRLLMLPLLISLIPLSVSAIELDWMVLSGGGVAGASASYRMDATVNQVAVGQSTSPSYRLNLGFWQTFEAGCCVGLRGNLDGLGDPSIPTLGDLTVMIDHLFITLVPLVCWEEGNLDGSLPEGPGSVTLGDLTVLIDNLFISLAPTPPCP